MGHPKTMAFCAPGCGRRQEIVPHCVYTGKFSLKNQKNTECGTISWDSWPELSKESDAVGTPREGENCFGLRELSEIKRANAMHGP